MALDRPYIYICIYFCGAWFSLAPSLTNVLTYLTYVGLSFKIFLVRFLLTIVLTYLFPPPGIVLLLLQTLLSTVPPYYCSYISSQASHPPPLVLFLHTHLKPL